MKTELIIKITIVILMYIASTLVVKAEETTKGIDSLSQIEEMAKESGRKIVLKARLLDVSDASEKDSLNRELGSPTKVLRISSSDLESGKVTIRAADSVNIDMISTDDSNETIKSTIVTLIERAELNKEQLHDVQKALDAKW